ncbi:MAG: phosphatidate cytidylyltransferase [Clostridia bacterium]|nr:phosphatidate cytidylyltransferase [Clostridia bacterium]
MLKRFISMIVGILILAGVMLLNSTLVFSIAVTVVAMIGLYEFYHTLKQRDVHPIEWLGYIVTFGLIFIPYIPVATLRVILVMILPAALLVLFSASIFSNLKRNILDISVTVLGMIYVTYLFSFLIFTRQLENGTYYLWFILAGAWITDIFAYLVGMAIGKHHFSEISPKKSIEGCIGGIVGCALFFIGYSYYLNSIGFELNYIVMGIIGIVVSIISQIGDFAASSIKRYCKVKDFGNIMPGHGGVLDRFDSILFVAPFVYLLFSMM